MGNESRPIKPILYTLILFSLVGISLASEAMSRFGLADSYVWVISVAFLISALLLGKKPVLVLIVLLGVVAINFPASTLINYGIDKDMLLAAVCAIVLAPTIFNLIVS
ncbi:MAG: hypothetical protein JKY98_10785 [Gammaproteobacteria bacterium]|nr:hypothetical protein [Gammaproteobacteria bacterium]